MYRYLFFDADGTLFDFDEAERRAIRAMALEVGITLDDRHIALYQEANLKCWKAFERGELTLKALRTERFERFNKASGFSFDPVASSVRYQSHLSGQGILYSDAIEVLAALKARGYTLYLASNGIATVQRGRIEAAAVGHYFDEIFISEEMGVQKPDVRYFDLMLAKAGLSEQRPLSLMIGDSLSSDIRGGVDSGLDTVWINRHGESSPTLEPTYTITELSQILGLLTAPGRSHGE